jgi:hypothetical protein
MSSAACFVQALASPLEKVAYRSSNNSRSRSPMLMMDYSPLLARGCTPVYGILATRMATLSARPRAFRSRQYQLRCLHGIGGSAVLRRLGVAGYDEPAADALDDPTIFKASAARWLVACRHPAPPGEDRQPEAWLLVSGGQPGAVISCMAQRDQDARARR